MPVKIFFLLLSLFLSLAQADDIIPNIDDPINISQAPLTSARMHYGPQYDIKNSVIYFENEDSREKYRLSVVDGLLVESNGKLFSRFLPQNIVVDTNGDLYFIPKYFAPKFRHTTPTAGGPVILAGSGSFKHGKILKIDNDSGHFWPELKSMYWGLLVLASKGIDLSTTKIYFMSASRAYTSPNFAGLAPEFMRNAYRKLTAVSCEKLLE